MTRISAWFKQKRFDVAAYGAAALLAIAIAAAVLDLRDLNFSVPLGYSTGGDVWGVTEEFKSVQETGSLETNLRIGAPLSSDALGDPQFLSVPQLLVRFLSLFLHDAGAILNVFFLLSFPLIAVSALYALRVLGFSYFAAFVPALLYSFLPYHLLRGEDHLLLATFWFVPPAVIVAFWIAGGRRFVYWEGGKKLPSISNEGLLTLCFCILIGSYHVYYLFFTIFLFLLAAAYGFVAYRNWQSFAAAAAAIGTMLLAFALNVSGYLIRGGGAQLSDLNRVSGEAEIYGLKFIQLLLPVPGHRIGAFAQFRHYYDTTAPLVNENGTVSLGIICSLGFLLLLVVLLFPYRVKSNDVLRQSATFASGCFLLATIGGLSSLFNYVVTPDIRAYNRIVVYIAFFSFVAVAWALEKIRKHWLRTRVARGLGIAGLALLLILGIADQSSPAMVPNHAANALAYRADSSFVHAIERSLPPGSAVFQLPYAPFPGSEDLFPSGIVPYRLFIGYLHSNSLRWSYGAMKGSENDNWMRYLSSLPVAKMMPKLVVAGFHGIYIERLLYADQKKERTLESELGEALHEAPLVSDDRTHAFFSLEGLRNAEISRLSEDGFARSLKLTPPLLIRVVSGCYQTESSTGHRWRWCGKHAVLAISNLTAATKRGVLSGSISDGRGVAGTISVKSSLGNGQLSVSPKNGPLRIGVTVPPGTWRVEFDAAYPAFSSPRGDLSYLFLDLKLFDKTTGDETDFYSY